MSLLRRNLLLVVSIGVLPLISCEREERIFRPSGPAIEAVQFKSHTPLKAGGNPSDESHLSESATADEFAHTYQDNAYMMAEGKRLFSAFNCVGCHGHGGGASGPALMDAKWRYGHNPEEIFRTIVEGRPNGMPAFGGKLAAYQVWQLTAYVRSMSGLVPLDAAPARNDDMFSGPPENSRDAPNAIETAPPQPAETLP